MPIMAPLPTLSWRYGAPVAELVDAVDSKSAVLWACWFESGQGHHI
jgi:hypothetical protein